MITLSADFQTRAGLEDTRKLLVLHLYYDDTNFLRLASTSCVIDGEQYMGAIKSIGGSTMKWNMLTNNNVTISPFLKSTSSVTPSK